jgi:hypothetical protein
MEIMRADRKRSVGQSQQALCFDVNAPILILKNCVGHKNPCTRYDRPQSLIKIGSNDEVGNTGLIFYREGCEAFCRSGLLSCNHRAGSRDILRIFAFFQFLRRKPSGACQSLGRCRYGQQRDALRCSSDEAAVMERPLAAIRSADRAKVLPSSQLVPPAREHRVDE